MLHLKQAPISGDIGDTFPTYAPLWLILSAGSLGGQRGDSPPGRGEQSVFFSF